MPMRERESDRGDGERDEASTGNDSELCVIGVTSYGAPRPYADMVESDLGGAN